MYSQEKEFPFVHKNKLEKEIMRFINISITKADNKKRALADIYRKLLTCQEIIDIILYDIEKELLKYNNVNEFFSDKREKVIDIVQTLCNKDLRRVIVDIIPE